MPKRILSLSVMLSNCLSKLGDKHAQENPAILSLGVILSNCISELGDKHAQENPAILSLGVMFFRWHNYLADKFMQNGNQGVEETFSKTRHWVIASLQVKSQKQLLAILICVWSGIFIDVNESKHDKKFLTRGDIDLHVKCPVLSEP